MKLEDPHMKSIHKQSTGRWFFGLYVLVLVACSAHEPIVEPPSTRSAFTGDPSPLFQSLIGFVTRYGRLQGDMLSALPSANAAEAQQTGVIGTDFVYESDVQFTQGTTAD